MTAFKKPWHCFVNRPPPSFQKPSADMELRQSKPWLSPSRTLDLFELSPQLGSGALGGAVGQVEDC